MRRKITLLLMIAALIVVVMITATVGGGAAFAVGDKAPAPCEQPQSVIAQAKSNAPCVVGPPGPAPPPP
jgi:hypothetical protein